MERGEKRIIWLTHSDPRPSLRDIALELKLSIGCFACFPMQPRSTCPGLALLTVGWALGPPTGQPDGDLFSVEFYLPDDPSLCQSDTNCPAQALKMLELGGIIRDP